MFGCQRLECQTTTRVGVQVLIQVGFCRRLVIVHELDRVDIGVRAEDVYLGVQVQCGFQNRIVHFVYESNVQTVQFRQTAQ